MKLLCNEMDNNWIYFIAKIIVVCVKEIRFSTEQNLDLMQMIDSA